MFNQYPYINLNDFNLDYILKAIKEMRYEVTNFVSINAIKYANPIQWNITSQYEKNTIVIDPLTGTAYISVAPVPVGVALTRPEYWTVVFDLGSFVTRAAKNFTTRYEQDTTLTATFPTAAGEWLVWGDTLYVANTNITAGDSYVVDGNIRRITVEEVKNAIMQLITDNYNTIIAMIGDLDDLTTTAKNNFVAAINELVSGLSDEVQARQDADDDINTTIGNLDNLTTTDKTSIVNAINGEVQARQDAIDEVVQNIGDLDDKIDAVASPITPYYRPENYGGVVNDPLIDNSPAIKAAILAANVTSGTVLLSHGVYYCQTPITIDEHLYNVTMLGAGGSYLSQTSGDHPLRGTSINYSGAGDFLHFSNGTWRCNFIDFDIFSAGVGAALTFSNDDDPAGIARCTNCLIQNVTVSFTHIGILVKNAAYLLMERVIVRHKSRNDDTLNTDTNPVGFEFDGNNEYITMRDCVSVPNQNNAFNGASWSHGVKVTNLRHWIVSNLDINDCDCAITLSPSSGGSTVGFIAIDSVDVARVHYGLHTITNVEPISNIVINQFTYTAELTLSADNRIMKFEKTSGASAYAVRGKFLNITPRTGESEMTYWIEADDNAIADGMCDFTFAVNKIPVLNFNNNLTCNENFAANTSLSPQTVDLNNYKVSGMLPFIVGSGSTNGAGYVCMVVNFSCDTHTFQLALPLVASAANPVKYRYYQLSDDSWGAWRSITAT